MEAEFARQAAVGTRAARAAPPVAPVLLGVAVGVALTVATFYPGYMSVDSFVQLGEARSGVLRDLHPPVMTWLLGVFDGLWKGPQGYLVFQCLVFWSGLALLVFQLIPRRGLALLVTTAVGLTPPIFALVGTVWKDVLLGGALLLAVALVFHAQRTRRTWSLVCAGPCLFLAAAARHNSVLALWPICLWAGWVLAGRLELRRRRLFAGLVGGLLAASAVGGELVASRLLIAGPSMHSEQQIYVFDLAAISVARNVEVMPPYFARHEATCDLERVKKSFTENNVCGVMFCSGAPCPMTFDPEELGELRRAWWSAVRAYPSAWFAHRWRMFKFLLSLGTPTVIYPFHDGVSPNGLGVVLEPTWPNHLEMALLGRVRDTLFFRGWAYLVLLGALAAIGLFTRPRHRALVLALSVSGLSYELSYFFLAPVPDFRLIWWSAVAAIVGLVAVWAGRVFDAAASGQS